MSKLTKPVSRKQFLPNWWIDYVSYEDFTESDVVSLPVPETMVSIRPIALFTFQVCLYE